MLQQRLHPPAERRHRVAQGIDLCGAGQLAVAVLRVPGDEEARDGCRHLSEHREAVDRQQQAEDTSFGCERIKSAPIVVRVMAVHQSALP